LGQRAQEGIAISRGQATQTFNTASDENSTNFKNAQSTFGQTQNDIGDYKNALSKFVSSNPYAAGGEFDATINPQLANVSDAGANSLAGALQNQVLRTGQNSAASLATAKAGAQQNTRDLSSSLADAQQKRIAGETGYDTTALGASAVPAQTESGLYGTSGSQANQELGTEEGASQTPSFWDELGSNFAKGLGGAVQGGGAAQIGQAKICWIAAELYGGWSDPRTILVRTWLQTDFSQRRFGRMLVAIYIRFGERTAGLIRKHPPLRRVFMPVFSVALRKAGGK
jgi:hypothetical protein